MTELNDAQETPYLHNVSTRVKMQGGKWNAVEFAEEGRLADHMNPLQDPEHDNLREEMARFLLEKSLSMDSYQAACDSLFGKKPPSSELTFVSNLLTEKTTEKHKHLSLGRILAYVELNLVPQQRSTPASVEPRDAASAKAAGRARAEKDRQDRERRVSQLFNWLRDKGVRRIVKLIVNDDPNLSCRDETIKECLVGFDIRYLDWDKDDMYIPYLKKCAPNLSELWLSWSGGGSTLLGWSSREMGLESLERLRKIHVYVEGDRESSKCNTDYIGEFQRSLKEHVPGIEFDGLVYPPQRPSSSIMTSNTSVQNNLWMDAVDNFCRVLTKTYPGNGEIHKKMHGVTIAVIDDGVKLEEVNSSHRFKGWQPGPVPPPHRDAGAWYQSKECHGTEMVKIIQRVCPYTHFFIGKLDLQGRCGGSVAWSAAQAIRKAIENKSNIISMSWTINDTKVKAPEDDFKELDDALRETVDQDLILYCAGQDQGEYEQKLGKGGPWPASSTTNVLKKIGSSTLYGKEADSANTRHLDYLLPGTVVHKAGITTGSSAATALAAGLAALILWCAAACRTQEANSSVPQGGGRAEDVDFQRDQWMNLLFDKLKTKQDSASLVDVTRLLNEASDMEGNCVGRLVELCKGKIKDV